MLCPLSCCTFSANPQLKNVLIMQNVVQLMVQCMRKNKDDVKVLDSCIFVLANLAYDNVHCMTHIIELGAVDDVFAVIENHQKDLFVLKSSVCLICSWFCSEIRHTAMKLYTSDGFAFEPDAQLVEYKLYKTLWILTHSVGD